MPFHLPAFPFKILPASFSSKLKDRQKDILRAIVEIFIKTATPVGSHALCERNDLQFSPATIRNEMRFLERDGFLKSPHTSSGREPTSCGFRFFVSDFLQGERQLEKARPAFRQHFERERENYFQTKKVDEQVFDAVSILSRLTENVAFATVPSRRSTFFLGISRMLKQPEFTARPEIASQVFQVLEENFFQLLESLQLKNEVQIFIGRENILPEIQSCTLLVAKQKVLRNSVAIGVLGPVRMDFARNILALESVCDFLSSEK